MDNTTLYKYPIGIDFSDFKIRFFQFKKMGKKFITIRSFGEILLAPGIITDGKIKDRSALAEKFRQMLEKPIFGTIKDKFVNSSVSEKVSFLQQIEIPAVPANELNGAVSWGVEQHIPYPIDQVYYDWQVIKNNENKLKLVISAVPKTVVDEFTDFLKKLNFIPVCFENESLAIVRATNIKNADPIMLIDIGKSRSTIMVIKDTNVIYSLSIDVSGNEMTNTISSLLKLSFTDAEKAKIIFGLDEKKINGKIKKAIIPIIDRLVKKIFDSLTYYEEYIDPSKKISKIFLCGSVSKMSGLVEYIHKECKIPTELISPLQNISLRNSKSKHISNQTLYSYSTAIGLAMRYF